jgi:hypothetical protein
MLRLQERVSQNLGVRGHSYEFFCRHGFPDLVEEGSVVDLKRRLVEEGEMIGERRTRSVGAMHFRRRSQSLES